jgi:hypothetical protein
MMDTKTAVHTVRKIAAALLFSVAALIGFNFGWRMFGGLDRQFASATISLLRGSSGRFASFLGP